MKQRKMTYNEAVTWFMSAPWHGSGDSPERMVRLMELLGNPQEKLKIIHVAGTNGKGSFCAMLASVLKAAGYRTGLYTSPYLIRFNERIQINGDEISDGLLVNAAEAVKNAVDVLGDNFTMFDRITAVAFLCFEREGCDYVVLECGLGGRLDATNVIASPVLSVITGIAMDHMEYLGDTIEKIAYEKSGIIKPHRPVLLGGRDSKAIDVIGKRAGALYSEFFLSDYGNIRNLGMNIDGADFSYCEFGNIHIPLAGVYQADNAVNVLNSVRILRKYGCYINDEAVRNGLSRIKWPGRFEIINRNPLIIFDGGHNPQGVEAAAKSVAKYFTKKPVVITGVMADKKYDEMAGIISGFASLVYTVAPSNPRALDADVYADIFSRQGIRSQACESIPEAVALAVKSAAEEGLPVMCLGSLYLYRDIINILSNLIK